MSPRETTTPPEPSPPGVLDRALELVRFLRANDEWDGRQTHESLIRHLLEESHEVAEAIHAGDDPRLQKELGDLLLNLAFQIVVAEERLSFTAEQVVAGLEDKMQRRHPHLYGLGEQESWELIKAREREAGESALDGVPDGFDPLHKAYRLQELASGVGFDWPEVTPAIQKLREEIVEVEAALGSEDELPDELGDLLFAVVNVIRLAGQQPTVVLERANRKFDRRFRRVEGLAGEDGHTLPGPDLETLDRYWERAKDEESGDAQ